MNILWVEDFGGGLPADSKALIPLFQGLIPRDVFVRHWDDEADLLSEPSILSGFFGTHSNDRVVLLRSVDEYLDRAGDGLQTSFDVFLIDINLDRWGDLGRDLPEDMTGIDKNLFHRKGGIYIYNHLVRNGVPPDNICFLSGEAAATLEFIDHCRDALMPRPRSFEKTDTDYPRVREWLRQRQEDSYITLRRAIIDGCEDLRQRVASGDAVMQFQEFIGTEGGKAERATRADMVDYLNTLKAFLPIQRYSSPSSVADHQQRVQFYRLFVRTLAHVWDVANPGNLRYDMRPEKRRVLSALGWIMKNVRNWMAHTSLINQLAAEDVAFLFLINMRAMFDLGAAPLPHERQVLSLVARANGQTLEALDEGDLRQNLIQSYRSIKEKSLRLNRMGDSVGFSSMVNSLVNANKLSQRDNCLTLLYQMFWHGLSRAEFTNTARVMDRKSNKDNLALFFSFDCRLENYRCAPHGAQDFLHELARAVYRRSFPQ